MRHARRVSVSIDGDDVVEDRRTAACRFDSYIAVFKFPRGPSARWLDRVSSTQTPAEDRRSFNLPDGTAVAISPVPLE